MDKETQLQLTLMNITGPPQPSHLPASSYPVPLHAPGEEGGMAGEDLMDN